MLSINYSTVLVNPIDEHITDTCTHPETINNPQKVKKKRCPCHLPRGVQCPAASCTTRRGAHARSKYTWLLRPKLQHARHLNMPRACVTRGSSASLGLLGQGWPSNFLHLPSRINVR